MRNVEIMRLTDGLIQPLFLRRLNRLLPADSSTPLMGTTRVPSSRDVLQELLLARVSGPTAVPFAVINQQFWRPAVISAVGAARFGIAEQKR